MCTHVHLHTHILIHIDIYTDKHTCMHTHTQHTQTKDRSHKSRRGPQWNTTDVAGGQEDTKNQDICGKCYDETTRMVTDMPWQWDSEMAICGHVEAHARPATSRSQERHLTPLMLCLQIPPQMGRNSLISWFPMSGSSLQSPLKKSTGYL